MWYLLLREILPVVQLKRPETECIRLFYLSGGKILNVEKASIDKILKNAEIKTMINAFGCGFSEGYGNDFDITKLRYDKIVIMTDGWKGTDRERNEFLRKWLLNHIAGEDKVARHSDTTSVARRRRPWNTGAHY